MNALREEFEKETGNYIGTKAIQFIAITNDGRIPRGKEDYQKLYSTYLENKLLKSTEQNEKLRELLEESEIAVRTTTKNRSLLERIQKLLNHDRRNKRVFLS